MLYNFKQRSLRNTLAVCACLTLSVSFSCSDEDPSPVTPAVNEQGVGLENTKASFDTPKTRTGTGWNIRTNTKI